MAYPKRNNTSNRSSRNSGQKKHSGAKIVFGKNGQKYISAWNYSGRHGLLSFFVSDYKKTRVHKSKTGKEWANVMVKVSGEKQKPYIVSGLLDMATDRVIINELGMVINPKAPNGGYCGTFVRK